MRIFKPCATRKEKAMPKNILHIIFLILLIHFNCNAQNDSIVKRYLREFDQYKQSREQEFEHFKNQKDSLFYEFLNKKWSAYKVFYNEKVKISKPITQPEISEEEILNHQGKEIIPKIEIEKDSIFEPEEINVNSYKTYNASVVRKSMKPVNMSFYSNEDTLFIRTEPIKLDNNPTIETIKKFSRYAESNQAFDEIISQLNKYKKKYQLNDWAYVQLIQIAAKQVFSDSNTQVLFVWYVLLKSGFKLRTGYSGNDIFLLIASYQQIYNAITVTINKEKFYVVNFSSKQKPSEIIIHDEVSPFTKKISMKIQDLPILKNQKIKHEFSIGDKKYTIDLNKALIDFFNDYPSCDLNIYFNTPLSEQAINSLDIILKPLLKLKSDKEKIAVLLKFVQESFPYKSDEQQFKGEKYMFADEVLKYPYTDCEDRAVLFAKLVKHYTLLKAVGLNYPGHVSVGVNLNVVPGYDFIQYGGEKYVVCDPTYIKASIGLSPKKYAGINPKVFTVD